MQLLAERIRVKRGMQSESPSATAYVQFKVQQLDKLKSLVPAGLIVSVVSNIIDDVQQFLSAKNAMALSLLQNVVQPDAAKLAEFRALADKNTALAASLQPCFRTDFVPPQSADELLSTVEQNQPASPTTIPTAADLGATSSSSSTSTQSISSLNDFDVDVDPGEFEKLFLQYRTSLQERGIVHPALEVEVQMQTAELAELEINPSDDPDFQELKELCQVRSRVWESALLNPTVAAKLYSAELRSYLEQRNLEPTTATARLRSQLKRREKDYSEAPREDLEQEIKDLQTAILFAQELVILSEVEKALHLRQTASVSTSSLTSLLDHGSTQDQSTEQGEEVLRLETEILLLTENVPLLEKPVGPVVIPETLEDLSVALNQEEGRLKTSQGHLVNARQAVPLNLFNIKKREKTFNDTLVKVEFLRRLFGLKFDLATLNSLNGIGSQSASSNHPNNVPVRLDGGGSVASSSTGLLPEALFDVFLCHRGSDKSLKENVKVELAAPLFGYLSLSYRVFLDKYSLEVSIPTQAMLQALIRTNMGVVLFSNGFLKGILEEEAEWCLLELRVLFAKHLYLYWKQCQPDHAGVINTDIHPRMFGVAVAPFTIDDGFESMYAEIPLPLVSPKRLRVDEWEWNCWRNNLAQIDPKLLEFFDDPKITLPRLLARFPFIQLEGNTEAAKLHLFGELKSRLDRVRHSW